eukprot:1492507-Amphidinium_carterae.1
MICRCFGKGFSCSLHAPLRWKRRSQARSNQDTPATHNSAILAQRSAKVQQQQDQSHCAQRHTHTHALI